MDPIHQLVTRHHFTGVFDECQQEVKFASGQRLGLPGRRYQFPLVEIECPPLEAAAKTLFLLLLLSLNTLQQILDAGQQFAGIEGLDDVVVGPALKADDSINLVVFTGYQNDTDITLSSKFACQRQSIFARQVDIDRSDRGRPVRSR